MMIRFPQAVCHPLFRQKRPCAALAALMLASGCAISHPPLALLPPAPQPPVEFVELTKQRLENARAEANRTASALAGAQDILDDASSREAAARERLANAKNAADNAASIEAAERDLTAAAQVVAQSRSQLKKLELQRLALADEANRLAALCGQIACDSGDGGGGNPVFTAIAVDSMPVIAALDEARGLGNIYRERYLKSAKLRTALDLPVLGLGAYSAWRAVGGISSEGAGENASADATLEALARVGIGAGVYTLARDRLLPSGLPATYRNGYDGMACIIGIGNGFLSLATWERQFEFQGARKAVLDAIAAINGILATMGPTAREKNNALVALVEARKELAAKTLTDAAVQQRAWESRSEAFGAAVTAASISVSTGALVPSSFKYDEIRSTLTPPTPTPPPAAGAKAESTAVATPDPAVQLRAAIDSLVVARTNLELAMPEHLARLERLKTCSSRAAGQPAQG